MNAMQPGREERTIGALVHAGVLLNGFGMVGVLGALIVWLTHHERSAFVRGHALQALVYQGLVGLITALLFFLWGSCLVLALLPALLRPDLYQDGRPPDSLWLALVGLLVPLLFVVASLLYGIIGAYQAYRGRPAAYVILGRLAATQPVAQVVPEGSVDAPVVAAPVVTEPTVPDEGAERQ